MRLFENAEGDTTKMTMSDEFIAVVGRKVEGRVCYNLSTTLRCNGKEALSFLLDVTSRSLLNERDLEGGERRAY